MICCNASVTRRAAGSWFWDPFWSRPQRFIFFPSVLKLPVYIFYQSQFSSVTQLCVQLFATPWTEARPALPVHHPLPEFIQTPVHWVGDAIQPSHLSFPSPAFSLSLLPPLVFPSIRVFSRKSRSSILPRGPRCLWVPTPGGRSTHVCTVIKVPSPLRLWAVWRFTPGWACGRSCLPDRCLPQAVVRRPHAASVLPPSRNISSLSPPDFTHRQLAPGPSESRQTVPHLSSRLAAGRLETSGRRYSRHQLWPFIRYLQARAR